MDIFPTGGGGLNRPTQMTFIFMILYLYLSVEQAVTTLPELVQKDWAFTAANKSKGGLIFFFKYIVRFVCA